MTSKPCPVPLFNFKKRQRKALVSDPVQQLSLPLSRGGVNAAETTQSDDHDEDFMELIQQDIQDTVHDFNKSSGYQQGVRSKSIINQSKNTTYHGNSPASSNSTHQAKLPMPFRRGKCNTDFSNSNPSSLEETENTHAQYNFGGLRKHDKGMDSTLASKPNPRGRGQQPKNMSGIMQTEREGNTFSHLNHSRYPNPAGPSSTYDPNQMYIDGKRNLQVNFSNGGRGNPCNREVNNGNLLGLESRSLQPGFGNQGIGQTSRGRGRISSVSIVQSPNQMQVTHGPSSSCMDSLTKRLPNAPTVSGGPSQKVDTSMHLLTCPITTVRTWTSAQLFDGLVVFEVYGIVNSAVTSDKSGTGKEFILRDDTSSIKCIFYEIDRQLPLLTRGQVHRVVGTLDGRRGIFKAISVRKAAPWERQVCHLATQDSMEEMARMGFHCPEP